ncbi:hypothetical protein ACWD4O_38850 [Streptomyces sp. NPDC002623]
MPRSLTYPTAPLPAAALHAMARIEYALAAHQRELTAKVAATLGFRKGWTPNRHLGETLTNVTAWTQYELNAVYERTGGTVQRSTDGGDSTWNATEITLTVDVPGIGPVRVSTDWDEESGGRDLPLMQAIPNATLIAA